METDCAFPGTLRFVWVFFLQNLFHFPGSEEERAAVMKANTSSSRPNIYDKGSEVIPD